MQVTLKNIAKWAEVSHMLGISAHRTADSFYRKIQGGLEDVAHSLIIGNSFFKHAVVVLSDSIYFDDLSAMSVEAAFP